MKETLKIIFCRLLISLRIDALFRRINRHKILILTYHGITNRQYTPPIITQLPKDIFEQHLIFLKKHYNVLQLSDFLESIKDKKKQLPPNSALITFDDGLMNNYTVAFSLLQQHQLPATIFLCTNMIGAKKMFWFDELYFLIKYGLEQNINLWDIHDLFYDISSSIDITFSYCQVVERMKRLGKKERDVLLDELRQEIIYDQEELLEDFTCLSEEHLKEMKKTGRISFGIHTANHRILTELSEEEMSAEINQPRQILSDILDENVYSFCYPNGKPRQDFTLTNESYLKECGYLCAFSTEVGLCSSQSDKFRLPRIPADNNLTSTVNYLRLNTSGIIFNIKLLFR